MNVRAGREFLDSEEAEDPRDGLPHRMMRRARGTAVIGIEFEVGPYRPRHDVVHMEDAAAGATEEAAYGTAVAVAFPDEISYLDPGASGVEVIAIRIHLNVTYSIMPYTSDE